MPAVLSGGSVGGSRPPLPRFDVMFTALLVDRSLRADTRVDVLLSTTVVPRPYRWLRGCERWR